MPADKSYDASESRLGFILDLRAINHVQVTNYLP